MDVKEDFDGIVAKTKKIASEAGYEDLLSTQEIYLPNLGFWPPGPGLSAVQPGPRAY